MVVLFNDMDCDLKLKSWGLVAMDYSHVRELMKYLKGS